MKPIVLGNIFTILFGLSQTFDTKANSHLWMIPSKIGRITNKFPSTSITDIFGDISPVAYNERNLRSEKETFSYDESDPYGPQNWGRLSEHCDGSQQSPISLYSNDSLEIYRRPLRIQHLDTIPNSLTFRNNGHSFTITFNYPGSRVAAVSGGPLKNSYVISQVHWHWGMNDYDGSEHILDFRRYSAEAHIVTYNSKYGSLTNAMNQPKGLAVLGFLYEIDNSYGASDIPFGFLVENVIESGSSYVENSHLFSLRHIIQSMEFDYLSYKGSLTTPNCFETVTWIVSTKPLKISSHDLAQLRRIKDEKGKPILMNYRPIQRTNYRDVDKYCSQSQYTQKYY
ncbi:CLUMA_CG018858, isoform A [Clunio marinus]|uniref:Carbonic anhydrase n=1 Tax=Clunio marinus TaxID=568069 RepID=A0A1J1J0A4_9DIPT|nr:CLUMA_CG018858, isoform A [Clunio marinus]